MSSLIECPESIFPASVESADPVVSSSQQNLNDVRDQESGLSKSDIIKKRGLLFANTLQELKQRYLPNSSDVNLMMIHGHVIVTS